MCCVVILAACGGGGSDAPPVTTVTLKLATSGTPSAQLAGISFTLELPDGVTPCRNPDGSIAASVATASGVSAPGNTQNAAYTAALGAVKGTIKFIIYTSSAGGFGAGEFATVSLVVAGGANPAKEEFNFVQFRPFEAVTYNDATGLTPIVASLAIRQASAE